MLFMQAVVSKFLLDDTADDTEECCSNVAPGESRISIIMAKLFLKSL